ncbi:Mitochondrial porin, partial [Cladochytrium tenue]
NKDYPLGSAKLEVNTTTANGIVRAGVTAPSGRFKFTVVGNKDNKTGHIHSELKTKYSDKARGLTVTEHWNAANVLGAQVELLDTIAKGVKLDFHGSIVPTSGKRNAKAAVEFKQINVFSRASVDLYAKNGPSLHADTVIGSDGFVAGGDVAYNVTDAAISRYNGVAGFIAPDYAVTVHATQQFSIFSASYFHRVSKEVEAGAKATWNKASSDNVAIEVGTKFAFDKDAFIKAKIDNAGRLGLGYTQVLRPGVKLALGGHFDTTRLTENVHRVGLSLTFDG